MQGDEVGFSEQDVQWDEFNSEAHRVGIGDGIESKQAHAKSRSAFRHRLTNATAPHKAERLPRDVVTPRWSPLAGSHRDMAVVNPPGDREQKSHGVVRNRLVQ